MAMVQLEVAMGLRGDGKSGGEGEGQGWLGRDGGSEEGDGEGERVGGLGSWQLSAAAERALGKGEEGP